MEIFPLLFSLLVVAIMVLLWLLRYPVQKSAVATVESNEYPELPLRQTGEFSFRMVPDDMEQREIGELLYQLNHTGKGEYPPEWEPGPRTPLPSTLRYVRRARANVNHDPRALPKPKRKRQRKKAS